MNRKPEAAFAVIDFGRTSSVCMDIHCPCGAHVHMDTWGEDGSAEHVRCPWCKDVLRIGADINLLDQREDFSVEHDAYVFIQWKGSDVVMGATCTCKQSFEIVGDFTYDCDCPHCGKHYHCESQLTVTKLSAEEAAQVSKVQEPEKHPDEMDDEERAAYDAKLEVQAPEQDGVRHDSGRVLLIVGGDFIDGARLASLALPDGVALTILPDTHVGQLQPVPDILAAVELHKVLLEPFADFGSRRRGVKKNFTHAVVEQKKGRYKQGRPGNPFAGDNAHIRNVQRNDRGPRRGGNRGGGRGK